MNEQAAKRFHHQSIAEWRKMGLPEEKDWPEEWKKVFFKTYPRFESIPLKSPLSIPQSLEELLLSRKTHRQFDPASSISLVELSTLLFRAAGIRTPGEKDTSKRFYPSAGARYPLEIYISANRIEELDPGIYHYNVKDNTLEKLLGAEACEQFGEYMGYAWNKDASATLLITAVWARSMNKYKDTAYRLLCIEAGHLSQNLQLLSNALSLSYASIVGFRKDKMEQLLDLEPDIESPLYTTLIGRARVSNPKTPSTS